MTYKRYVELCVGYNLIYVFILKLLMSLSKVSASEIYVLYTIVTVMFEG